MVGWDVIREEGLDINGDPASRFEHSFAFAPYCKQVFEIFIPFVGIIMGILCIGMPEIVGRRGNDQIDAFFRDAGKNRPCIPADDPVCEGAEVRGFSGTE